MKEIQLGRYEYCMETSAVSPDVVVHPAGAGRGEDGDHRPVERAGPFHLTNDNIGTGLRGVGRGEPGVQADGFGRRTAGECLKLFRTRRPGHEIAALPAQ
jgi:hypothetical protein